ncbi:MAG: M23 family metallopeptidase [Acetatifactor sp.]|nr:M23 family metallopeptidase [Acetatifactor sp.]
MRRRRHKRKNCHVVIVTSDAVDTSTKHFRIKPWVVETFVLLISVAAGAVIGYFLFEQDLPREEVVHNNQQREELIAELEEENVALQTQIAELTNTVQILSDTVIQKAESENSLTERLEQQYIPTEFPVTSRAQFEEITEGNPMLVFTTAKSTMVVVTANGTVTAVNDDGEYGHNVWVDHGNGYVTIYRNQGEVMVKQGETVRQGSTLFISNEENSKLGYQVMKDGEYINPMDVLAING